MHMENYYTLGIKGGLVQHHNVGITEICVKIKMNCWL